MSHDAPHNRPSRADVIRLGIAVLFFAAAPTAGDIGGCGQSEDDLDPRKFFVAKHDVDHERCEACQLTTKACVDADAPGLLVSDFPPGCVPLVHDGEVCLHALAAAGCGDYASYMADQGSTIPTECNFCPPQADAGVSDAEVE